MQTIAKISDLSNDNPSAFEQKKYTGTPMKAEKRSPNNCFFVSLNKIFASIFSTSRGMSITNNFSSFLRCRHN